MKYITTTMQPAKAGSHRNAIRIGEQDSWAYLAYPSGKEVLKEMFIVNGDNLRIKDDIIRRIETTGEADVNLDEVSISGSKTLFSIFSTVAGLSFD